MVMKPANPVPAKPVAEDMFEKARKAFFVPAQAPAKSSNAAAQQANSSSAPSPAKPPFKRS
jgi:hypothetical protein